MNNQACYFRSLPLHPSQKEIENHSEYSVFEYWLKPTYDFEQEILSHREDVEVLEPVQLREIIRERFENGKIIFSLGFMLYLVKTASFMLNTTKSCHTKS